ncbi:MAG: hypothetical protein DME26_20115 [Verrucomicrobia bacterium]|nr:MAG: hypothetical protein DME26_20115 [Verrucomicrobiota bacterium]
MVSANCANARETKTACAAQAAPLNPKTEVGQRRNVVGTARRAVPTRVQPAEQTARFRLVG